VSVKKQSLGHIFRKRHFLYNKEVKPKTFALVKNQQCWSLLEVRVLQHNFLKKKHLELPDQF